MDGLFLMKTARVFYEPHVQDMVRRGQVQSASAICAVGNTNDKSVFGFSEVHCQRLTHRHNKFIPVNDEI